MNEIILLSIIVIFGVSIIAMTISRNTRRNDVATDQKIAPILKEVRFRFTYKIFFIAFILLIFSSTICLVMEKFHPGSNWFWYQFFGGCALGLAAVYGNNFRRGVRGKVGGLPFRYYFHPFEAWLVMLGFSQAIGALFAPILLKVVDRF